MNEEILQRFNEYATHPAVRSPVAAAVLTLADVLYREPIIVESDDPNSYTVKDAAELLKLSSRQVYRLCLAGTLRCYRTGRSIRIPVDEIKRFESEVPPSPALVPLNPR